MRSLGQIPLVIGALAIFSTLQLTINASILNSFVVSIESEATLDAMSISQAMIDEIMTKAFDENTLNERIYDRNLLTPAATFGSDSGEVVPSVEQDSTGTYLSASLFDDVDDYHGYTRIIESPRLGDFIVRDSVIYVQEANQDAPSSWQTWYKKVIVTVTNANMPDPLYTSTLTVYRRFF